MNIQKDRGSSYREFLGIYGFIGKFVKNNTIYIFVLSLVFVGFAIYGITKIDAESSIFESFPESSEITRSTEHIEQKLMGLIPMDIVVDAGNMGGVFQPDVLVKMENLQDYLKGIPEVTKSVSIVDYVEYLNKLLSKKTSDSQVLTKGKAIEYVKLATLHGDSIVKSLYTEDYNEGRVSVRMKNVGSSRVASVMIGKMAANPEICAPQVYNGPALRPMFHIDYASDQNRVITSRKHVVSLAIKCYQRVL